jgi:hypothetical protein
MVYQYRCRCIEWRMQRVDVDRMGDDAHDVPHVDLYDIGYYGVISGLSRWLSECPMSPWSDSDLLRVQEES